jgi:hypothetical protein
MSDTVLWSGKGEMWGDVNINILVWEKMLKLLRELYANDDEIISVIKRANFKIEVQNIQDENKILVDIDQCQKTHFFKRLWMLK